MTDDRIISVNLYKLKHNSEIGLGLEGTSARIILLFKESEDTNIIHRKRGLDDKHGETPTVTWLKIDEKKRK